jgi:RNA polymerase-binding transcription factor DksA
MKGDTVTAKPQRNLEPYKKKLRELYAHLTAERDAMEEAGLHENLVDETGERPGVDTHPADAGTELFLRERDQVLENNLDTILEQCERALKKIEDGTYGYSDESGEFIGEDRLDAVPYANLTVEEQEHYIGG